MAAPGGLIGAKIYQAERDSLSTLWSRVCAAPDDPVRGDLPARCDRAWYIQTFCEGAAKLPPGADEFDAVWPMVQSVNLYSPIAVIGAMPFTTFKNFLHSAALDVRSATHHVIGLDKPAQLQAERNKLLDIEVRHDAGLHTVFAIRTQKHGTIIA